MRWTWEGIAEEVAGWKRGVCGIRGVSGMRDHWSWEGTGTEKFSV